MSQFVGHATAEDLLEHINKSTEALYLQKLIQVCMMIMIKGPFIFLQVGVAVVVFVVSSHLFDMTSPPF